MAAITDFDQAIAIDPRLAHAYLNRGITRASLGQHQPAIADIERFLELEPQDARTAEARAEVTRLRALVAEQR